MKKLLLIGIAMLYLVGTMYSQNDTLYGFYYAKGIRHYWVEDFTSLNIIVNNLNHYDSIVARLGRIFNNTQDEIFADNEDNNIIVNSSSLVSRNISEIISAISLSSNDIAFTTYAKQINGNPIWLTNEAYVKLKNNSYYTSHIQPILLQYPNVVSYYEGNNEYRFVCPTDSIVVTLSNKLYDTAYVVYSSPDFYSLGNLHTNDHYFNDQWNLKNTGQNGGTVGVDIKAEEAWAFLQKAIGASGGNVKVAVIDDGVEEHEDFYEGGGVSVILDGYTANGDGNGRPRPKNKHGECCAGIIAAVHNNNGLAGIAPHSRIVPIRIFKNLKPTSNNLMFSARKVARAIEKSWEDFNASILSCSWELTLHSDIIEDAVIRASEEGRNGKGCIVVFSSGNTGIGIVGIPSELEQVLCVGSMDKHGHRLNDSNHGWEMDLVAPGVNIITTDRMGNLGYCNDQTLSPDYYTGFGQTSAACPHVSGVAALMLSVNPNLHREQVYAILENTAQKVGGYDYNHIFPNGTWDQETGYGLVDAHKAVVESFLYEHSTYINGPANFSWNPCEEHNYSLSIPHPEYFTYIWSCSSNLTILSSNQNTAYVTAKENGTGYIRVKVYSEGRLIRTYVKNITVTTNYYSMGTNPITVTSNTSWTYNNYAVLNDVIIESGVTLTISGTVYCSNQGCFKVKPQGRLIIDSGRLTNLCFGEMWPGIEVWGNSNTHQFTLNGSCGQGQLELRNGAVIENAVCAVELWHPGYPNTTGGIVNADSAIFRNNAKAVHALHYTNHYPTTGNESNYKGSFHNCTFTIDGNYFGTQTFYQHIDLNDVNGVQFSGCSFSIGSNAPNISASNCGIAACNAGFLVSAYCDDNMSPPLSCPEQYLVRCSFTGFRYAISSIHNGANARSFTVRKSVFNNNDFGIYAINTGYATILNNSFSISSTGDCSFGIFADGVTQFCIEENSFQPYGTGSGDTYGIGIFNSCRNNDVYLNTFSGLTCGNLAVGTNTSKDLFSSRVSRIDGLTYHCNQNSGNLIDFYVLKQNGNGGILPVQGSASVPAGNTFDGSGYHFYNDGDGVIDYYYNSTASHEVPDASLLYRVNRTATTNQNGCETHYGTLTKSADEKAALASDYLAARNIYSSLSRLYTTRIDGGSTAAEVADLLSATPSDQTRLRDKLLRHSPYLSQEALTTAAERHDIFPDPDIFEILAANPDELKKDTLIRYLEDKTHPLPDYMIDLLRQIASGVTERTALTAQMARYCHDYSLAAGDIVRSVLNDSVANPQELRTWLGNMGDIASDRMAVASFMQENDYENAFELANLLPDLYELSGGELEDHSDYMRLLTLYRTLHESNRTTAQMTDGESRMVDSIANQGHGTSQSMAKAIIMGNSGEPGTRYACPDIPRPNRTKGYSSIDENGTTDFSVAITPNPARSQASVIYTLPNETSQASLVFTNALGVRVISTELEGDRGEKTVNFGELPSGVYNYTARCGNSVLNGKIMVTH